MANTEGRDVVGRLRSVRDAALAGESYWVGGDLMPVRISELEALLAVVEAAQRYLAWATKVNAEVITRGGSISIPQEYVDLADALARFYDGSSGETE